MYVPQEFDDYQYLVSYGDNYILLSNRSSSHGTWESPDSVSCIIQYFKPSIYTIPYIYRTSSSTTFSRVDIDSDFYSRADCPEIVSSTLFIIFFLIFILNGITKFVKRGGIFFGS